MHCRFRCAAAALLLGVTRLLAQNLVATPYEKSGIYKAGQTVGWTVRVAEGQWASPGGYSYIVKQNGDKVIKTGTLDLSRGPVNIETSLGAPGVVLVEIRLPVGVTQQFGNTNTGGDGVVKLGAAVEPTKIQPVLPPPADFDTFWSRKIEQLSKVPMGAVVTPKESGSSDVEYATVKLNNLGGAHVYAQMARPKREGKFPALLIYQWASAPYPLQPAWVIDRAKEGWLTINVEPHDVPSDMPQAFYDALPQMIKQYNTVNATDREHNYFLQMYLGDYRAIEYLATLPEWDGRTLVVTGTSMGGQQSLVMAGLSPRVTGVVVNVPAGGDANAAQHGRMAGYPNWDVRNPLVAETARYFDVVNFAPRIKAPVMASMGFIDEVTPALGIWTVLNRIPGVKEPVPMIDSPHNHQATPAQLMPWTVRSEAWLAALRRGDPVPPK
ncbi:MAG TPA: acetylxylan esterase [Gemmatimonadaceae bacterium]|nr:acetylxylan esterase [Gemmatimonadaceae bacterium]